MLKILEVKDTDSQLVEDTTLLMPKMLFIILSVNPT